MILSIDIGGTFIKFARLSENYAIQAFWSIDTFAVTDSEVFYDSLVAKMGNLHDVKRIAICLPGIVSDDYNILSKASPRVKSMYGTNIAHEIKKRTGLEVFACNDAHAAAVGEYQFGSLKNTISSFTYVIGTAVGGCYMIGNSVQKGSDNYAASISMMPLSFEANKPIWTYTRCSANALFYQYHAYSKQPLPSAKAIIEAAEMNNDAATVVDQWVRDIARSLFQVSVAFNPHRIAIGGGVSNNPHLVQRIEHAFLEIVQQYLHTPPLTTKVVCFQNPAHAHLLGVAYLANQ